MNRTWKAGIVVALYCMVAAMSWWGVRLPASPTGARPSPFWPPRVPGFTDNLKHAVVTGAVTGGDLTIIANAPNPAAVSILKKYFTNGIGAGGVLRGAPAPTVIMLLIHLFTR